MATDMMGRQIGGGSSSSAGDVVSVLGRGDIQIQGRGIVEVSGCIDVEVL